jgi:aldehyde dehydrogenase (NAD+)
MVQDNTDAWLAAARADLGRPDQETVLHELGPVVDRCLRSAELLEEWAAPLVPEGVPDAQKGLNPVSYRAPKGVVLLISCALVHWTLTTAR